ncbi:hypothetical protein Q8791_29065 [Nocardiopsis sp. CT-R113]|uniref:Tail assembly chaperone n=1 Tax=Nocardiopsis codii TaxID=3065942 RepID=A0ABU7KGE2_9ACTN|nr:hypothetical protein [Nocardiopsis sp. CT-R113]MEE2041283.1 hypothetical protein [Nocardiopsis sp. CT-R113]
MTEIDDQYDEHDQDDAAEAPDGFGTFDDYRESRAAKRAEAAVTTVILGEEVTLPAELPIGFELRMHRLGSPGTTEAETITILRELVAMLYGDDALDEWQDDLDLDDLQVLVIWGAANVRKPYSMTFPEAAEVAQAAEGKARKMSAATRPTRSPKRKRSGSSKR